MGKKNKIVVEIVEELITTQQHLYEEIKVTLLAIYVRNAHMTNFLIKAFDFAEEHRPKLLEVKGGVV